MRILVFDVETSGLNPQWNVILQLSYQIVDTNSWATLKMVNHYFPWPENKARVSQESIRVNGLTEEVLATKQLSDLKTALEEFVTDKDSCELLVAHNLEFDKTFIIAASREEGVKYANSGWSKSYDTMKRTINFCQIPKEWGRGYKWPKLTELADRLYIDYSNIALHDSSGDVELTKLCFERIVANRLYSLPAESDITISLHVESPDDLRYEIMKNGVPVDELTLTSIYGVPKKQLNTARQDLIRKWSEENDKERYDLIEIYRKSPKIKSENDFRTEIEEIKPNQYVRKCFEEQPPSKDKILEELEQEAEQVVSSWMFWTLKKKRIEYVNSRLEQEYQQQLSLYKQRLAQHEENENKAEEEYNQQSEKRCEEYKQRLTALIEGEDVAIIRKELLCMPERMSLSFPYHIESTINDSVIDINLSLPQAEDLPHMEGVRLASGNYKIKEIPDKVKKIDYSNWVRGIAFYVAAHYFNISPQISKVNIEGHVKADDLSDISLYAISFDRETFGTLSLEDMEIEDALAKFTFTNNITKEVLARLFVTKEKISKTEASPTPKVVPNNTHDPLFAEAAHLVVVNQNASVALLQRTFNIGFQRVGSILDQLEKAGIVGPMSINNPASREILVSNEKDLETLLGENL